jgi:hypothetical protein
MIDTKEKTAALVILIYSILLGIGASLGALLGGEFGLMTLPVYLLMFVGPAIGIMKRKDWCRVFLGCCFGFVFVMLCVLPFQGEEFHFKPVILLFYLGSGIPVYLLFFWKPLKRYTKSEKTSEQVGGHNSGGCAPSA